MRKGDITKIINTNIKINHSDSITKKIKFIQEEMINNTITADEAYLQLSLIKINSCPICVYQLHLFEYQNCPKIAKKGRQDKDINDCDQYELKHIEYRAGISKETIKIARNFIDQSDEAKQYRTQAMLQWQKENPQEFSKIVKENIKYANKYWEDRPQERKETSLKALEKANQILKECWSNEEWVNNVGLPALKNNREKMIENQRKLGFPAIKQVNKINKENNYRHLKIIHDKMKEYWSDEEWRNTIGKNCLKNLTSHSFDVKKFYSKSLDLLNINSLEENICINNICDRFPGVWAIWHKETNECLQVGQNQDVYKELRREIRLFNKYGIENYPKDHKDAEYWHKLGVLYYKGLLEFKLIAKNIEDLDERLIIEIQYAHDNKAKYWNIQFASIQQRIALNKIQVV